MEEPRRIVLVLGNGFDLDLGLKTSYKDFWESENCPKDYPAPLIAHLNQRWPDNREAVKWYDLENELLNYYLGLSDPERGVDIISSEEKELLKEFSSYGYQCGWYNDKLELLQSLVNKGVLQYRQDPLPRMLEHYKEDALQSPIWRDRKALNLIKEGLCNYLQSISGESFAQDTVALNVLFATNFARESGNSLSIYTFNYTPIPVIYSDDFQNVIHYVHGECKKGNIIIGTRDDGEYVNSYDFLQKSFDSHFNPPPLVADLLEADEVVIFGHSIGENDRQYFKAFFKQQTDFERPLRKGITIFTWDENSEVEIKRSLQKMTDNNLSTLYGLNQVEIIKTSRIKDNPNRLFSFFSKYIKDEMQVRVIMNQLLSAK